MRFKNFLALVAPLALALPTSSFAASPAEISAQRQQALDDILNSDTAYTVAAQRWVCAMGKEPATVSRKRQEGAAFYPDAADTCVAALTRTARDRQLPELYTKLLSELGGAGGERDGLPDAIGVAALGGQGQVPIGNGKAMNISPPLAFDAGFTVGYKERGVKNPGRANPEQLKALSQNCLSGTAAYGACFSAGYMFGAKAAGS